MKRIFKTADGLVVVDLVRCGIDHLSAAKLLFDSVGVGAVQEALSGMAYYNCQAAWVITTGTFTTNALELA